MYPDGMVRDLDWFFFLGMELLRRGESNTSMNSSLLPSILFVPYLVSGSDLQLPFSRQGFSP
jgi:hypothetical protein